MAGYHLHCQYMPTFSALSVHFLWYLMLHDIKCPSKKVSEVYNVPDSLTQGQCNSLPSLRSSPWNILGGFQTEFCVILMHQCIINKMIPIQPATITIILLGWWSYMWPVPTNWVLTWSQLTVCATTGKSSQWGSIWVFSDFCKIKVYKYKH